MPTRQGVLHNAIAANNTSATFDVNGTASLTFHTKAASVTSGATMAFETLTPAGDWSALDSRAVIANGNTIVTAIGTFTQVRAVISGYVDGTYTTSVVVGT